MSLVYYFFWGGTVLMSMVTGSGNDVRLPADAWSFADVSSALNPPSPLVCIYLHWAQPRLLLPSV